MKTLKTHIHEGDKIEERFNAKKLSQEVEKIKLPGFESKWARDTFQEFKDAIKKAKKFADFEDEYERVGDSINRPQAIQILKLVGKFGR